MIKRAVIPAAGLGTRFLPATKAQPKEMLPIVDKPAIQYIVEEAAASGIEDIIIISGRGKRSIEDHFDKSFELEEVLRERHKDQMLEEVQGISNLANIFYIRQKEPKGLGDAIACARPFIGNEPFAVLLGDDIISAKTPVLKQLMSVYNDYGRPVIGVQEVAADKVSDYGIVDSAENLGKRLFGVGGLVEKPTIEKAPSRLAIMGRYILTPDIFPILERLEPGAGGEIQLTDALNQLNRERSLLAYEFEGFRYDIGNKFSFIVATIETALRRDDLKGQLRDYLLNLADTLKKDQS